MRDPPSCPRIGCPSGSAWRAAETPSRTSVTPHQSAQSLETLLLLERPHDRDDFLRLARADPTVSERVELRGELRPLHVEIGERDADVHFCGVVFTICANSHA